MHGLWPLVWQHPQSRRSVFLPAVTMDVPQRSAQTLLLNTRKSSMRQRVRRKARALTLPGLLLGLAILLGAATVHAQLPSSVDFQVIHLTGIRGSAVNYLAIRSQNDWNKFWQLGSVEPTLSGDPPPTTTTPRPPLPKIDFKRYILLIAETGVKPSSRYENVFESVQTAPASMRGPPSDKMATIVHVIEMRPGNCPVLTELTSSVSYALIPQTTNEIRFSISRADSDCTTPVTPPFIK
jgi:hypothetical protein